MSKHKLLIVDNSEDFPMALSELLCTDYQIQYCLDGKEALSLLRSFQPDILLMELMIPQIDGISLLEAAASEGLHPQVITFTRLYNEYMMDALTRLKVKYFMVKPCDLHATADRILDLTRLAQEQSLLADDPQAKATELLLYLGLVTKHHGFAYLRDALIMEALLPGQSVTKEIYPTIAEKYNCSQANVEHSIRTAITYAWLKRSDAVWMQYFLPNSDGVIPRPTNATVITRLAQELCHK